jgi:hypothetical protein
MFGLPQDIFGEGPFGIADWGRLAIYEHLPVLHRTLDAEQGYPLRDYFRAFQGEAEEILGAISQLIEQRQPLLARDGANVPLIQVTGTATGATTTVTTLTPHGFTAGQVVVFAGTEACTPPIRGVQSIAQVLSTTQFTIDFTTTVGTTTGYVQAYDRSAVPVWVTGAVVAKDPDYGVTTTFTFQNGTDLDYLGVGYTAVLTAGGTDYTYKVARLRTRNADDSAATRNSALCYGQTLPPASALSPPYLLKFVQPSALAHLTADFGLIYDENDPQVFRRSLVNNVAQYVMQKASQKGYQIRGNVAGFDAVAQGLYALCEDLGAGGSLPVSRVYEIDGEFYTDIPPRTFAFDDIGADIEWVDPETGSPVYPLDEFIYSDASGDNLSPLGGVATSITANYTGANTTLPIVTTVAVASAGTLSTYSVPYGYVVTVQFPSAPAFPAPDPHRVFNVVAPGVFALVGPSGATEEQYFIEAEVSWNAGLRRAVYLISVPTAAPSAVTIPLGSYRIGYFPKVVTGCCYCKSYRVRLIASPSSALYDALGGSGTAILAALDRLVVKLQREQLPIHSEIAQIVLNIPISVSLSPTVSIVVS